MNGWVTFLYFKSLFGVVLGDFLIILVFFVPDNVKGNEIWWDFIKPFDGSLIVVIKF